MQQIIRDNWTREETRYYQRETTETIDNSNRPTGTLHAGIIRHRSWNSYAQYVLVDKSQTWNWYQKP